MIRRTARTPTCEIILQFSLILLIAITSTVFITRKLYLGSIGHWSIPVVIVNCLLNGAIVLYFGIRRYRRAQGGAEH
jgi:hypothetical protein